MEQKIFAFDDGSALQAFIDQNRDRIVGHTIKACYIDLGIYCKAESAGPVFLILDDICLGIDYLFEGHIRIITVEESDFEFTGTANKDPEIKSGTFHSRTAEWKDEWIDWYPEMPGMDQKIVDISLERFSHAYENYIDGLRPDGGDYFSEIRLTLEDGTELHINADDSWGSDGFVEVWLTNLPASSIRRELDSTPFEMWMKVRHEFDQVVSASSATPDELAELVMYYMRKCDHEMEKFRKKHPESWEVPGHMYSFTLDYVMSLFIEHGMNKGYVDPNGRSLRDLANRIGDYAKNIALKIL